jgi:hypothetical protein
MAQQVVITKAFEMLSESDSEARYRFRLTTQNGHKIYMISMKIGDNHKEFDAIVRKFYQREGGNARPLLTHDEYNFTFPVPVPSELVARMIKADYEKDITVMDLLLRH